MSDIVIQTKSSDGRINTWLNKSNVTVGLLVALICSVNASHEEIRNAKPWFDWIMSGFASAPQPSKLSDVIGRLDGSFVSIGTNENRMTMVLKPIGIDGRFCGSTTQHGYGSVSNCWSLKEFNKNGFTLIADRAIGSNGAVVENLAMTFKWDGQNNFHQTSVDHSNEAFKVYRNWERLLTVTDQRN